MNFDHFRQKSHAMLRELLLRLAEDHGSPNGMDPEAFAEEMAEEFLYQLENDAFEGDEPLGALITVDDIMAMLDWPNGTSKVDMELRNLAYSFFDYSQREQAGWDY